MTPAQTIPSWTEKSPLVRNAILIIAGSFILAASARISVPLPYVPLTMQTFALLLIGAFYGSRLAFATCCAYLFEGAIGLPVFSGGAGGAQHLIGTTAGYLVAFPFAASFVGYAFERKWAENLYTAFGVMTVSHLMVLTLGTLWLANFLGVNAAIVQGFTPFVLGSLVKSGLAVAVVLLAARTK